MHKMVLGDYLLIAQDITGIDANDLATMPRVIPAAESALAAPFASFGGVEFYEGLPLRAAILCSRLVRNHPLPDGNKRVAYVSMIRFIRVNGAEWAPSADVRERHAMIDQLAAGRLAEEDFAAWVTAQMR